MACCVPRAITFGENIFIIHLVSTDLDLNVLFFLPSFIFYTLNAPHAAV